MNVTLEFVHNFAASIGVQVPQPSNAIYAHPIAQLHEVGHFAVTQVDWYQRWSLALNNHAPLHKASPYIPCIHSPFADPMPRDLSVQVWVGMVIAHFGLEGERLGYAVPWGDRNDFMTIDMINVMAIDWGKNPLIHLSEWGINPIEGRFTPVDDGFQLPHPDAIEWDLIIENWQAIALQYPHQLPIGSAKVFDLPEVWANWLKARFPSRKVLIG